MPINFLRITIAHRAGSYVKECRLASGVTQRQLEISCGFPSGFIGKLERGEIKRISIPYVYEIESQLKKFKRSSFEVAGKTELEITKDKPFAPSKPIQNKGTNSKSKEASGAYRISKPVIESIAVQQPKKLHLESDSTMTSRKTNLYTDTASTESSVFNRLWTLGLAGVAIYFIATRFFGGEEVETSVPQPISTYQQAPAYVPDVTQQNDCGYNDFNCDGIDDSQPYQPAWNPGYDYDGDGFPNIGDTDVNGDGNPNGTDWTSDPFEIGGLSSFGCPVGQQSC